MVPGSGKCSAETLDSTDRIIKVCEKWSLCFAAVCEAAQKTASVLGGKPDGLTCLFTFPPAQVPTVYCSVSDLLRRQTRLRDAVLSPEPSRAHIM